MSPDYDSLHPGYLLGFYMKGRLEDRHEILAERDAVDVHDSCYTLAEGSGPHPTIIPTANTWTFCRGGSGWPYYCCSNQEVCV
jgi:hypothetical protein